MNINIIAAISKNRVIGNKGKIPWHISKDLKYFQKLTTGKGNAVLMGFNTWKSLPTYPEPLPNRGSIVITKNNTHLTSAMVYNSPDEIDFHDELFQKFFAFCLYYKIFILFINSTYSC